MTPPLSQGPAIINDESARKPIGIDLLARPSPQAATLTIGGPYPAEEDLKEEIPSTGPVQSK
jgi:hypothetical protein